MLSHLSALLRCDLAIDLGTAATRMALPGEGIVLDEPSVVAVARSSNRILSGGCAVGHLARQMSGRTPDSVSVVRPLSAGVITDFQLCEAMLRYFLRKVRPMRFGLRPRLLMAAPSGLTPVEKRALLTSAHRAGAGQVLLISVAQAAALGVGLPVAEPVASMVIDIGAGATEVAVISLGDVVARHAVRVGGDQMDQAVVEYLRRECGLRIGLSTAEQLRIELGCNPPSEKSDSTIPHSPLPIPHSGSDHQTTSHPDTCPLSDVRGIDVTSGLPRRIEIGVREMTQALADPLERIVDCIRATLDQCSPDLVADLVDRGVVLCGGGSLLRGLDRWLFARTGLPARVAPEAQTAVVQGTLTCLEHLDTWHSLVERTDGEF
jgi:rod shape-determining protein MreB and related proteins